MGGKSGDQLKITRERAEDIAKRVIAMLPSSHVSGYEIAGSYRRGKELLGDVELILIVKSGWEEVFAPIVGTAKNGNVSSVYVLDGTQVDLFYCQHLIQLPFYQLHCTGSWQENKRLRTEAIKKRWLLNQYMLGEKCLESEYVENDPRYYRKRKNMSEPWKCYKMIECKSEQDVYEKLGLEYKEPHEREVVDDTDTVV